MILSTLDDVDPELLEMYKKLGISVDEQKMMNNVAMDIVVDSETKIKIKIIHFIQENKKCQIIKL
jgi:molybdopterin converting factor small subunit